MKCHFSDCINMIASSAESYPPPPHNCLKEHKHEITLNFFLTKIKSLYSFGKFKKKISLLFLRFSPEFRSSNSFAVTEHTRNQIFLERYSKKLFFKMFSWVLFIVRGAGDRCCQFRISTCTVFIS